MIFVSYPNLSIFPWFKNICFQHDIKHYEVLILYFIFFMSHFQTHRSKKFNIYFKGKNIIRWVFEILQKIWSFKKNTSSFFKYNEFKCAPLPHMFLMWASHWSGFMIFNEKGKYALHKCALHTTHIQPIVMPSCHQMYSHHKMWMTHVENVKHDVLHSDAFMSPNVKCDPHKCASHAPHI